MVASDSNEVERLETALGWLRSHRKRMRIERQTIRDKLGAIEGEIDRLTREIELAESKLRRLSGR